ncbi:MAG: GDP-mannose 4,6-dehydratase [Deltaproteobacteria bacterium]|nr:GDP-mannose 4,6-dehydratase [Deltaproteobacteria bacterium]
MKSSKRKILIIGYPGQDGRLLWDMLDQRGCAILALGRKTVHANFRQPLPERVPVRSFRSIDQWMDTFRPDEVYYLAAYHSSSEADLDRSIRTSINASFDVHVRGIVNVLESVARRSLRTRVFYASSSMIFDGQAGGSATELDPLKPQGIYGITKAAGTLICRQYRETKGVYCSVGILYNHESILRPKDFISQKIIRTALEVSRDTEKKLVLGDLSARVDWGYAPDYVDAFTRILHLDAPDDFIISTGEAHSVQEFVSLVFDRLGLDWKRHVVEDPRVLGRRPRMRIGDPAKLMRMTDWRPSLSFRAMVYKLIEDTIQFLNLEPGPGKTSGKQGKRSG